MLPDRSKYGYRLAFEIGCSAGCEAPEVSWWWAWRRFEMPPRPPVDDRGQRYANGAVRRVLAGLPPRPTVTNLRRAAFEAGSWIEAGDLPARPVARALIEAASRAGLDPANIANQLAADMAAGRAKPRRLPA